MLKLTQIIIFFNEQAVIKIIGCKLCYAPGKSAFILDNMTL